jgi:hypothetical protein
MYLSRSDDGGKSFSPARKLGDGTWPLDACPMDGGAVAVGADGSIHTFWRRAGQMFACAPGGAERPVGAGEQGWMAAGPGGEYRVWLQQRPGALLVLAPGQQSPLQIAPEADDPVVAAAPGGKGPVVVVWKGGRKSASSIRCAILSEGGQARR